MIQARYQHYSSWRPRFMRIGAGFVIYLPWLTIQVGHHCPPCRECGQRKSIICWDEENSGAAICPDCCEHPDYEYDRGDRRYWCIECGNEPPYDWHRYDD